ncbi:MAG: hypothetical protein QNJ84_06400 [Alphaproteobacteria bacterium]|nr:hypothetical protein [Alphaproteobacteria bacterium]
MTDPNDQSERAGDAGQGRTWLGLLREIARRRPTYILALVGVCLAASVFWSVDLIRHGDTAALVLVGVNLFLFVVALIYLADDLQSR